MKRALASLLFTILTARAELFVSSHDSSQVMRFHETTGAFIDTFVPNLDHRLQFPHGLAFGPDRHLYVSSAGNDRVLRYNGQTGAFLDEFVPANRGGLDYPVALIFRGGFLYVSSQLSNQILRYHAKTGAFVDVFVAERPELNGPSDMRFGPDGNLYVIGRFNSRVVRYHGTTGAFIDTFIASGLSQPFGLRFTDAGLLVVNGNANDVQRFNATTGQSLGAFITTSPANLNFPVGLSIGHDGNLYVASYSNDKIARFNPTTGVHLGDFVSTSAGGINGPNFITFRPIDPTLAITLTPANTIQISWPLDLSDDTSRLYESATPDFASETVVTTSPVISGSTATVTVSGGSAQSYFRIHTPSSAANLFVFSPRPRRHACPAE